MQRTNLPPDRSRLETEKRNHRTRGLDILSTWECVDCMIQEDRSVHHALEKAGPELAGFAEAVIQRFQKGGRLIYVGAGTSGRLGVLDASEAPPTFHLEPGRIIGIIAGGDAALRQSSEGMEDDPNGAIPELKELMLTGLDTVLGITAGGTTPYVLGALAWGKQLNPEILTGLMSCSPVHKSACADWNLLLDTGPEVLTGSTRLKAGTATKMALNILSTTLMIRTGRVYENLMVDLKATNDKLRDRGARIIREITGVTREEAFLWLDRAQGQVKHAVLMQTLGLDVDEADRCLRLSGGHLATALQQRKIA